MKPDWLKAENDDYWTVQLGRYKATIGQTMFGNFSYSVSDDVRVLRSGNVGTLEIAQMVAEDTAKSLAAAS